MRNWSEIFVVVTQFNCKQVLDKNQKTIFSFILSACLKILEMMQNETLPITLTHIQWHDVHYDRFNNTEH